MAELPTKTLSLDELIAFNDELAALARAGVPLEVGLAGLGNDLPAGLSKISRTLAAQMEQGQSLANALAATGDQFPPVYRALVTAGIRAGRLPAALEQTSASARRMAALRRVISGALVYPSIVVLLGYTLFLFFIVRIAPVLDASAPLAARQQPPAIVRAVAGLKDNVQWWGPILPTVAVMLMVVWWLRSRRATVLQPGVAGPMFGRFAPVRRLLAESSAANMADTMALLIENQMPLSEALVLAAEATGDAALIESARRLAAEIAAGGRSARSNVGGSGGELAARPAGRGAASIPPLLHWLIVTGAAQKNLAAVLRQSADMYRRRAIARADWLRWRLPVMLTVGIGGTVTLAYALALFLPWISLLRDVAR